MNATALCSQPAAFPAGSPRRSLWGVQHARGGGEGSASSRPGLQPTWRAQPSSRPAAGPRPRSPARAPGEVPVRTRPGPGRPPRSARGRTEPAPQTSAAPSPPEPAGQRDRRGGLALAPPPGPSAGGQSGPRWRRVPRREPRPRSSACYKCGRWLARRLQQRRPGRLDYNAKCHVPGCPPRLRTHGQERRQQPQQRGEAGEDEADLVSTASSSPPPAPT